MSKTNYLTEDDGWFEILDHPQQHFFFKKHSLCGMYKTFPKGSHHDNVPLRHCQKCTQILRKLIAVSSQIAGKKLNASQVMKLIDALESIKLNKGMGENQKYPESVVAVVTSQKTQSKKVYEVGNTSKKKLS